jgi:hypothetical protein
MTHELYIKNILQGNGFSSLKARALKSSYNPDNVVDDITNALYSNHLTGTEAVLNIEEAVVTQENIILNFSEFYITFSVLEVIAWVVIYDNLTNKVLSLQKVNTVVGNQIQNTISIVGVVTFQGGRVIVNCNQ